MGNVHHPHRGSMQFWPRKRSRHSVARIRSFKADAKAKLSGFIGYKAGMMHVMAVDNRAKSLTKGENIALPVTILDCPPLAVVGVSFYKKSGTGIVKFASILCEKLPKHFSRATPIPKKQSKKIDEIKEFDDLRLLVCSNPSQTSTGGKKPKLLELAVGGSKTDKFTYAKAMLGKDIAVSDVFEKGLFVDVKGISKGKGFQGTVKRYGVPIRQHKAEKTKRGIANLGSWTPKRVEYTVAIPGKMGFHTRTEHNKQILKVGSEGSEVVPAGGITKYGLVSGSYLLVHGSVVGSKKRAVVLTNAIRPPHKVNKEAFEVSQLVP